MNKPLRIVLMAAVPLAIVGYLLYAYGYAAKVRSSVPCRTLVINVAGNANAQKTMQDNIAALFAANGYSFLGRPMRALPTDDMEQLLKTISFVENADVYAGIDGVLHADITLRTPILRIFTTDGSSFYVDNSGFAFRMPAHYACHTTIANGSVPLPFEGRFEGSIHNFLRNKAIKDSAILLLLDFANYIAAHPFWSAQIEQIFYAAADYVELVPRVGAHVIKLGSLKNYIVKLRNLKTFYSQGTSANGWNTYRIINLTVPNQVICVRR